MSGKTVATITKMVESLPDPVQERVAEHLREYIEDLNDEMRWDSKYQKTRENLAGKGGKAKAEIAEGKAKPMDFDKL